MSQVKYRYNTLEDFLISNPLSVDGTFDDGWEAKVTLKGREIGAAILPNVIGLGGVNADPGNDDARAE